MQASSNHSSRQFKFGLAKILFLVIAAFAAPASANDSLAAIGSGGIELIQSDALQMEREELYISVDEVRVKYTFRNLTNYSYTGTVAFPMPDLDMNEFSESRNQSTGKADDIVEFHVRVNGQDIKPSFSAKAINTDGQDVTALLHLYNVPIVNSKNNEIYQALKALKPDETKVLLNADTLLDAEHPSWIARSVYHWEQTFPANTPIIVEHWYKPLAGGGLISTNETDKLVHDDYFSAWCPDESFASGVHKLKRIDSDYVPYRSVDYILKTGANWAGPIGYFRLEVDKGTAALLSTCPIPGLNLKKSGNSFISEANKFKPAANLKFLFVYDQPR